MARLRVVDVWPMSGFVDAPWLDARQEDAFAKAARGVCELFNEGLAGTELKNSVPSLRLFVDVGPDHQSAPSDPLSLSVSVLVDRPDGFEVANVHVPASFLSLTDQQQREVVLDVVTGALGALGAVRGWDLDVLARASRYARSRSLRYRWEGPWKQNPSRRLQARCLVELRSDGFGALTLQVKTQPEDDIVGSWGPFTTGTTSQSFARAARTLKWLSPTTLAIDPLTPYRDHRTTLAEIDVTQPPPPTTPTPAPTLTPTPPDNRPATHPLRILVTSRGRTKH